MIRSSTTNCRQVFPYLIRKHIDLVTISIFWFVLLFSKVFSSQEYPWTPPICCTCFRSCLAIQYRIFIWLPFITTWFVARSGIDHLSMQQIKFELRSNLDLWTIWSWWISLRLCRILRRLSWLCSRCWREVASWISKELSK